MDPEALRPIGPLGSLLSCLTGIVLGGLAMRTHVEDASGREAAAIDVNVTRLTLSMGYTHSYGVPFYSSADHVESLESHVLRSISPLGWLFDCPLFSLMFVLLSCCIFLRFLIPGILIRASGTNSRQMNRGLTW